LLVGISELVHENSGIRDDVTDYQTLDAGHGDFNVSRYRGAAVEDGEIDVVVELLLFVDDVPDLLDRKNHEVFRYAVSYLDGGAVLLSEVGLGFSEQVIDLQPREFQLR